MTSLYYDAYEEMAISVMRQIVDNTPHDCSHRIYVCHRLGEVPLGESSILIAVSSPHRSTGHQLVMQILNEIKQSVPIWKKVYCTTETGRCSEDWSQNSEAFWIK